MASRAYPGVGLRGDWALGEDNWKDEMDGNLLWLSVLVQGRFVDQVTAEPGSPTEGMVYILAAAHATHPNELAVYDEGAWHYKVPSAGWRLYNTTLGLFSQFNGTIWANDTGGTLDAEGVRDIMAAALASGTNVTVVNDDPGDTITINASGGGGLDAEGVRDAVAAMMVNGTNVTLTYNDGADTLTVAAATPTKVYRIGWFFTGAPTASEVLLIHTFTDAVTFADDFLGAVGIVDGTMPASTYTIDVQKNNASVGSISISTGGVITYTTAASTVAFAVGDRLKLVAPGSVGVLTNASGSFRTTY